MHPGKSTIARRLGRATMSTTPPPLDATPERPPNAAPRASRPTPSDATVPPESVRITDVPAQGGGRAFLVERELEQDGYDALRALVADYLNQAELLADVPMAVSGLN
jgi:hypothetical protein